MTEKLNNTHLTSKQTQQNLKIKACDLMHMREAGKLRYEKKGNAFLYLKEDVEGMKKKQP